MAVRTARRVGACVLLGLAGPTAGCSLSSEAESTTTTGRSVTTTTALRGIVAPIESVLVGQCFDDVPDAEQQPFAVLVIGCEDPHTYEVFAEKKYPAAGRAPSGADYPGDLVVANDAEAQCVADFTAFMGISWEESDYEIETLWPSPESWDAEGDRSILCAVFRVTGGRTTGTVRGTAQ